MCDQNVYFYVSPSGEKCIIDASKAQEFLNSNMKDVQTTGKNLAYNAEKSIILEPAEYIANNFDTSASSNPFPSAKIFQESSFEFHTAKRKSDNILNNWSPAEDLHLMTFLEIQNAKRLNIGKK
ncbi:uncharacterized protein LOC116847402 [Odontomachus brunneus]|uniref:uncharacterized protein LOC116847402 n=1 Tax=Odontomachus brunneus TaxID=486640 RepID=UPI0013F1BA8F|nr:uncharacterized protein LOC116847402 [Odontomachus brunneus]